jgi:hypothetical protein
MMGSAHGPSSADALHQETNDSSGLRGVPRGAGDDASRPTGPHQRPEERRHDGVRHIGQVKVQKRNWNLTLSVFWMTRFG